MKKAFALILVLVTIFCFAACGKKDSKNDSNGSFVIDNGGSNGGNIVTDTRNPEIVAYLEQNSDALTSGMEAAFSSSSGMTCSSSWEVEGNGIIIIIRINELDDLDSASKQQMQSNIDSLDGTMDSVLTSVQSELPAVEFVTYKICEADGDLIASLKID